MIIREQKLGFIKKTIAAIKRRRRWFTNGLGWNKFINICHSCFGFILKKEHLNSFPVALKVDISPLCNLRCPFCVHGTHSPIGAFKKTQRMTVNQFDRLINEIKGHTSALSLYYLGDPLTHPDLNQFCSIAKDAGIFTHISTNFSFNLSDEKLKNLVLSGLNHITVCLDGYSQERYSVSRVGGRVEWVKSNLSRICEIREATKSPITIEVQFIQNDANRMELDQVIDFCREIGVDEFATYETADYTMESIHPDHYQVMSYLDSTVVPRCYWPYFFMTIKWNGDVIPCCSHRQDEQYNPARDPITSFGNIFETSLLEVWNSPQYITARKYVSNPNAYANEANEMAKKEFCHGCSKICEVANKPDLILASAPGPKSVHFI